MRVDNDINLKNYKKRKVLRIFIIIFGILTITLSVLSLTIKLGAGYALIAFIVMSILTKLRNNTSLIDKDHNISNSSKKNDKN